MRNLFIKGFVPCADYLIQHYGLVTAAVYGQVWRYCQMHLGKCNAGKAKIGEKLSLNPRTIKTHLDILCVDGYLVDLTPDKKNGPHDYQTTDKLTLKISLEMGGGNLIPEEEKQEVGGSLNPGGGSLNPGGGSLNPGGGSLNHTKKEEESNKKKQVECIEFTAFKRHLEPQIYPIASRPGLMGLLHFYSYNNGTLILAVNSRIAREKLHHIKSLTDRARHQSGIEKLEFIKDETYKA